MENYFNYFTEIEEHFWKKRGTSLLLSTLDWALIETWKESAIPLEAVLKGIDRAFEKHEKRRHKVRMVNSLAYCQQAVLEAAEGSGKAQIKVDSEGGVQAKESKTRFIAPVISLVLASRAADNEHHHDHDAAERQYQSQERTSVWLFTQ